MLKAKTAKPRYLPPWANEPLTFPIEPDEALRRCAFNRLPQDRKQSKSGARRKRSTG
jgi:hypothetical protein